MFKFFGKNIPKACAWCIYGKKSEYNNDVFCLKKGVTTQNDCCKKYKYDPLKREPRVAKPADGYDPENFKL